MIMKDALESTGKQGDLIQHSITLSGQTSTAEIQAFMESNLEKKRKTK